MQSTTGPQVNDRIRLVSTDDPYTKLRPGDTGTCTGVSGQTGAVFVRWDSGSTLSLLDGIDVWEVVR